MMDAREVAGMEGFGGMIHLRADPHYSFVPIQMEKLVSGLKSYITVSAP